jgi:hypothetical protein
MTTTLSPSAIITELKHIEGIRVGNPIHDNLFFDNVIGVTIHAPSSIRKAVHTLPMMQEWCKVHGFTLTDKYPCCDNMQIYF